MSKILTLILLVKGNLFDIKLATDRTLGRLTKWLRILGYDVISISYPSSKELTCWQNENRIYLTRIRKQKKGIVIESDILEDQLREVIKKLKIPINKDLILTRCLRCNLRLQKIEHNDVKDLVPDYIFQRHSQFLKCPKCKKIYWPGSHRKRMLQKLKEILGEPVHKNLYHQNHLLL